MNIFIINPRFMLNFQSSDGSGDIFSDYVTLGKSSDFETVIWHFPNTNHCPLKECKLSCSSRSVTLAHFHMHHADTTMICTICNELISVKNPLKLFRHYQEYHPKESPPKLKPVSKEQICGFNCAYFLLFGIKALPLLID